MASRKEMADFLESVEKRAFKQALYAVRQEDNALDIVQDSMMKLADRYAHAPAHELPLIFQRILQNTIRDHYRRSKVRSFVSTLLSSLIPTHAEDDSSIRSKPWTSQPTRRTPTRNSGTSARKWRR